MQKKVSAAVRAFGRAHKAGLALLGGGAAALGVFWVPEPGEPRWHACWQETAVTLPCGAPCPMN